ncbi:MAG TPA: zinc-binding dehydrogenase [Armatimonadota bacterium]|nr:zinc-binding dehydrogenase [Armatimonadota bacterium]
MGLPESMLALRLHGPGLDRLRFDEVPTPRPGPGQLVGRVEAAIACASDNKIIDQGGEHTLMYGWDLGRYPVPMGHEGCITVAAVGEGLSDQYQVGRRFAIQPAVPSGPRHYLERYRDQAAGIDKVAIGYTLDGLFAEYVLITEEVIETGCLLPLPAPDMPAFAAALAEPLSCVVSAQEHTVHVLKESPTAPRRAVLGLKPGGIAAVLGAGPMGRMHVEVAVSYGPKTIIVSDPIEARIDKLRGGVEEKARKGGAELILTDPDHFEEVLAAESGGQGADDIIVALGVREVQERAFSLLAPYGVVNFFGGLRKGEHMISLDSRRLHYDSVMAVGSSGGDPSDVGKALALLAEGTIDAGNYIAAVGGLEAAKDLVEAVRGQELEGKGVIYPRVRGPLQEVDGWDAGREADFLRARG